MQLLLRVISKWVQACAFQEGLLASLGFCI
jgi:hypothetical protein